MVVVRIELWPKGDVEKARLLGLCKISNDGTNTGGMEFGNYDVVLSHAGRDFANTISKRLAEELQKAVRKRGENLKNALKSEDNIGKKAKQ